MSFLNPPAATPKLGVNLATVMTLRDLRPSSRGLDLARFAQAAEEAGADVIRLTVDSSSMTLRHADIDAVMCAVTEVHFSMPLTREMIDFAGIVRPQSVCFHALNNTHNPHNTPSPDGAVISDSSLSLIHDALAQLCSLSMQIVVSLDPVTSQLQSLADAGITAVEFDAIAIARADPADQHARFSELRAAILTAQRSGMAVHLAHGVDYELVGQLAASGEITQINVGHAVAIRAMTVGWQSAVREMKALMVAACAPSMVRSVASATP